MTTAQTATHTTVTVTTRTMNVPVPSIREIILRTLVQGGDKTEAERLVKLFHSEAAGAAKFTKHYAWYKGWLKTKATPKELAQLIVRFS